MLIKYLLPEILLSTVVNFILMLLPLLIYEKPISYRSLLISSFTYACFLTLNKLILDYSIYEYTESSLTKIIIPLSTVFCIYIANVILKKEDVKRNFDFKKVFIMFIDYFTKYLHLDTYFIIETL